MRLSSCAFLYGAMTPSNTGWAVSPGGRVNRSVNGVLLSTFAFPSSRSLFALSGEQGIRGFPLILRTYTADARKFRPGNPQKPIRTGSCWKGLLCR